MKVMVGLFAGGKEIDDLLYHRMPCELEVAIQKGHWWNKRAPVLRNAHDIIFPKVASPYLPDAFTLYDDYGAILVTAPIKGRQLDQGDRAVFKKHTLDITIT